MRRKPQNPRSLILEQPVKRKRRATGVITFSPAPLQA
jgi:hypothetical protein